MKKKTKDIFTYALAAFVMLLIFGAVGYILTKVVPAENKDIALLIFGNLMSWGGLIVGYFFASSKGSQEKTDIIAKSGPVDPDK